MKLAEVVNGSLSLIGVFVGFVVVTAGVTIGVYLGFLFLEKLI